MKKYLLIAVLAFIFGAAAGIWCYRTMIGSSRLAVDDTHTTVASNESAIRFVVRQNDGTATMLEYFLGTGNAEVADETELVFGPARFNQSSFLCSNAEEPKLPNVSLRILCDIGRNNTLMLAAYDGDQKLVSAKIDPRDFGIAPSAAEGYLIPVAVADDKSTIYLGRRVETESWVAGLWKLDVATGNVSEITYVRENNIYQYDINPQAKKLFGISFVPPESLGEPPTRSEQYWVDLSTGEGYGGESFIGAWENPMLGDDGLAYAFYSTGDHAEEGTTVFQAGEGTYSGGTHIDGVMKDWFGDTIVFDRDGNLFLFDLKTKKETQLTNEMDATVEYVGRVE
jgi:hypothetical protein